MKSKKSKKLKKFYKLRKYLISEVVPFFEETFLGFRLPNAASSHAGASVAEGFELIAIDPQYFVG